MKRRNAIIIGTILIVICTGIGSVWAMLPSASNSGTFTHTTSVDIQVLNVIPAISYQPLGSNPVAATGVAVNANEQSGINNTLTSGFSFAPEQGFSGVNSVLVTVVYLGGTGGYDGFRIGLNGHRATSVLASTTENTAIGKLPNRDLVKGANMIVIGLNLVNLNEPASTYVYQVHLTVEYTLGA